MHIPGKDDRALRSGPVAASAFAISCLPSPVCSSALTYHRSRRVSRSVNKLVVVVVVVVGVVIVVVSN